MKSIWGGGGAVGSMKGAAQMAATLSPPAVWLRRLPVVWPIPLHQSVARGG